VALAEHQPVAQRPAGGIGPGSDAGAEGAPKLLGHPGPQLVRGRADRPRRGHVRRDLSGRVAG
jgi:hypothetical protein